MSCANKYSCQLNPETLSVEQLEPTRNLLLENPLRIILLANSLQLRLLLSTIPAKRVLPWRGVVKVEILVAQAQLLRLIFALLEEILGVLLNAGVVVDTIPRHRQEQVEEVAVSLAQAEGVPTSGSCFGCDCRGQGLEAQTVSHSRHVESLHRAVGNVEDPRHQLRAVAVRPRDEELAAVGAGRACEFEGEVREIGDAHCAYGLREVKFLKTAGLVTFSAVYSKLLAVSQNLLSEI